MVKIGVFFPVHIRFIGPQIIELAKILFFFPGQVDIKFWKFILPSQLIPIHPNHLNHSSAVKHSLGLVIPKLAYTGPGSSRNHGSMSRMVHGCQPKLMLAPL
jgi:hypothetical protein